MIQHQTPTQQPHSFYGYRGKKPAKGPGVVQRVMNYGKAVAKYHCNRGYKLPLEIVDERKSVCHTCNNYDAKLDRCQHRKCGCTISKKVTWSTEKCPQGHWLPVFGPAPAPTGRADGLSV